MSRNRGAPFGRRKKKEAELEPVPVIELKNVEADTPPIPLKTTPQHGSVIPDETSKDRVHTFQRLPVKTLDLDNIEVDPMVNIPHGFRKPTPKPSNIIQTVNVEVPPQKKWEGTEPTPQTVILSDTLHATLYAAANTPPEKKGEKKVIRL